MQKFKFYVIFFFITTIFGLFEVEEILGKDLSYKISSNDLKEKKIASLDYSYLDREWTDEEIIQLGYMPGEILVMFKKDRVNLKNRNDQDMVRDFFSDQSPYSICCYE